MAGVGVLLARGGDAAGFGEGLPADQGLVGIGDVDVGVRGPGPRLEALGYQVTLRSVA